MNNKWFLIIINFIIIIISNYFYKNFINKGLGLNFVFVIGILLIFWVIYYLVYKNLKK